MRDLELPIIIALLGLIVELLCVPLRHRKTIVRKCIPVAVALLFLYFAGPFITATIASVGMACYDYLGMKLSIAAASVFAFLCMAVWLAIQDRREIRAIRSGSVTAFNNRVETYIRDSKYSREKAIEVTTRIRDEK